jgi:ADP-ribose pyrophosphatase YjhB (NUDIX family)
VERTQKVAHIHEKIDFVVDVFIVYNRRVLLRKHDKYHLWLAVGGHIELDENPNQAAVREVKEEVGLDIVLVGKIPTFSADHGYEELIPPVFMNIHAISETHRHISLVYFANSQSDKVIPSGTDISDEWRWLTKEELERNELGIKESIRFYALEALKES